MKNEIYHVGDQFTLPSHPEYFQDVFTVISIRSNSDFCFLDAICDGDPTLDISVSVDEVEKL